MKKFFTIFLLSSMICLGQDYVGVETCQTCHTGTLRTFPGFASWQGTLHAKIHLPVAVENLKGNYSDTVNMGSSYGNAKVSFRVDGANYFVNLIPASGSPVEYQLVYTYGGGWKQRYLVKIGVSYYIPPVQWNAKGYLDNSTGDWVSYNPQNWFTSAGALKPVDNAFRKKSWDKNCAGCHVVPGAKTNTVNLVVAGSDTSWVYGWGNNSSDANIVVGCESCHGPRITFAGPGHVLNPLNLSYDRKLEVCGQCHFRGSSNNHTYEYPYDEATGNTYKVGEDLMAYIQFAPGLWPDGKTSKQHHQQWLDYKQAAHYNESMGITCVTCHDPHQVTAFPHQLKQDFYSLTAGVGCASCHADKVTETNGINDHTKHPQAISQCVNCHMTKNATSAKAYDISNHSFMVIRPNATLNFSGSTGGMINTCAVSCHRNGQGNRGSGYDFGIVDASLTNWAEATDIALADTLWRYYQVLYGVNGVEVANNNIPSSFMLGQNYPNPFNPSTSIDFSLPKHSNVKIEVFSLTGELVNILTNQEMEAGNYKVSWDGRTAEGLTLVSGVYIYRLVVDNQSVVSKKMVMVK